MNIRIWTNQNCRMLPVNNSATLRRTNTTGRRCPMCETTCLPVYLTGYQKWTTGDQQWHHCVWCILLGNNIDNMDCVLCLFIYVCPLNRVHFSLDLILFFFLFHLFIFWYFVPLERGWLCWVVFHIFRNINLLIINFELTTIIHLL